MQSLKCLPTSIAESVQQTFAAYEPLLDAAAPAFVTPIEHQYGPLSRQKLDIYVPPSLQGKAPVMIFLYGGGLVRGAKRMPGGAYQNVGSFFAKQGYLTILPDYRLVQPGSSESASFPSGATDLALALTWLKANPTCGSVEADLTQIFAVGNSAGAVHLCTYLYSDALSMLQPSATCSSCDTSRRALKIKAACFVGMPADFLKADSSRAHILETYYGGNSIVIGERSPAGLRELSDDETPLLLLTSEFDPEDEILEPNARFRATIERLNKPPTWDAKVIRGHNHISPPLGLGIGSAEEEQWGLDVIEWFNRIA